MARPRTRHALPFALFAISWLVPSAWASFSCDDIQAQGVQFNLKELGGPHIVHWTDDDRDHGRTYKYNFTIDICNKLEWHKGGTSATECSHGARVCAIEEEIAGNQNSTITPIDIAGTFVMGGGRSRQIDARFELLRDSKSNSDANREGIRAELHGGRHKNADNKDVDQQAIIEFVCDRDRDGLEKDEKDGGEHVPDPDDDNSKEGDEKRAALSTRDEDDRGKCEDTDASLRFCGYRLEEAKKGKQVKTLRLEWRTKYACENAHTAAGTSWGFFTWFIIILFLATAAYLIFGSWLNYNRYGARGWDLLPHGDTIRDIPYMLKDFGRKVVDTVQGPGSRGGYSAV